MEGREEKRREASQYLVPKKYYSLVRNKILQILVQHDLSHVHESSQLSVPEPSHL